MSKRVLGSVLFASTLTVLLLALAATFAGSATQAKTTLNAESSIVHRPSSVLAPQGVWADIAPFPTVTISPTPGSFSLRLKRANAAAYPANSKVYVMGGRHGIDGEDEALRWIWEYTPGSPGSWLRKTALLDGTAVGNRFTANMAVAVLTNTSGTRLYAIGGSSIDSAITSTVRIYDPVADSISSLTSADNWPASPARIPGGYAVHNNKLYIFGGFSALGNGAVFTDTWRFDPMAAVGSKWTQLASANLNLGRGYIAGAMLDGFIYAIGGDTWNAATDTLIPVANVERMDPSAGSPSWTNVASLPTVRGDAGAWAYDTGTGYEISGQLVVAGGVYPTPDNKAYLYDPGTNTWNSFASLNHPTRNFGAAQLNGFLYAMGGYDFSGGLPTGANFSQRYDANLTGPTATPTVSPTRTNSATITRTRTNTSTATPTNTSTPTDAFAHLEPPGPLTVAVNTKFALDLMVNTGSSSSTAAQHYFTFTNSIVQMVDNSLPGCVITSVVTTPDITTFDATLQNETCNGPGTCIFRSILTQPGSFAYASGALSNCPTGCAGDFRVAQVAFCGVALGDALLHWEFTPPAPVIRDSQIIDFFNNNLSNRTLYTDYVIHVVAAASTLTGHVNIQGRPAQPNALQSVPITLTLKSGASETDYSSTTDASGFFTVSAPSPGTYDWRVKTDQTLANSGSLTLAAGSNSQEMGLMLTGDANDDNCVTVSDFNILKAAFGTSLGDPSYDARADFTGEAAISIADFNLLRNNFAFCGAGPISPGAGTTK